MREKSRGNQNNKKENPLNGRIQLRVTQGMKVQIVSAASAQGVSINTWIIQAVNDRLSNKGYGDEL